MKATIWHNPKCSTSRKALARLEEAGAQVEVVLYLQNPPGADELAALYAAAGITPAQGLRTRNTDAVERGLTQADDATVLAAMVTEPVLIERPIVQTEKGTRLCRPFERIEEIL